MSSETSSREHRESTPRSKRLRRTSDNYSTSATTTTAITTTSSGSGGVGTSFDSVNRNSNTNYISSNNIKKTFSRESSAHPFHTSTSTNTSTNRNTRAMSSFVPDAREPSTTPMDTTMTSADDDPEELDDLINKYNFSLQEALLFLRIRNRGYEPLMPAHWQVDFGTMPDSLFFNAEVANEVGHIDSITLDGTFSATNAFRGLVALGAIVRGKMEAKKDPEDRVLAAVRKYVRWSVEDVKKRKLFPHRHLHP